MSYVVVNKSNGCLVSDIRPAKTLKSAKAGLTRWARVNDLRDTLNYVILDSETYNRLRPRVLVPSLMTGKMVEIDANDRGTCVDPSTERYWSM